MMIWRASLQATWQCINLKSEVYGLWLGCLGLLKIRCCTMLCYPRRVWKTASLHVLLGIGDLPRFKTVEATTQSPELWSCIRYVGFDFARYALVMPQLVYSFLGMSRKRLGIFLGFVRLCLCYACRVLVEGFGYNVLSTFSHPLAWAGWWLALWLWYRFCCMRVLRVVWWLGWTKLLWKGRQLW